MNYSQEYIEEMEVGRKFRERYPINSYDISEANRAFPGSNFMTPDVLSRGVIVPGVYVEISSGRGLNKELIIGVTFRNSDGTPLEDDPSGLAWSYDEAVDLIKKVEERYREE